MHPAGDEPVALLSGQAVFLLHRESGDESVELIEAGAFVIVPKGTWHSGTLS